MKNTFYRPGEVSCREFDQIISAMRESLDELVLGKADKEEVVQYTRKLIDDAKPLQKNPSMMFWGLGEPESMPSDSRVLYFYKPTYIAVSILAYIKMYGPEEASRLSGFDEVLKKGLLGATGRGFSGSGHDGIIGLIEALDIFTTGHIHEFVQKFPEICPTFTAIFLDVKSILEEKVKSGKVQNGWGQDFMVEATAVMERMRDMENETMIFVYGTLLYGNSNHEYFLGGSKYLGDAVLEHHALYDLGNYPGIKNKRSEYVKGEVYLIDEKTLQRINHLEGEGSLYSLKKATVEMGGQRVPNVGVYVYMHDVNEENYVAPENQPWGKKKNGSENLVWYAAYGSNMLYERLMCYLNGGAFRGNRTKHDECGDTTAPKACMSYEIPHDMYYGNNSGSWENKGVSFIDVTKPGKAYGAAYLITREQFEHIYKEENNGAIPHPSSKWYSHLVELGTYHHIPVMTITNRKVVDKHDASLKYKNVLMEGLKENYPHLDDAVIETYVESRNK